jgi:hypothetical protein
MSNESPISPGASSPLFHDIFGVKPYGEIGVELTKGIVAGASAFLSRICLPVAEEVGDWAREEVHHMRRRRRNAVRLAERARRMVEAAHLGEVHAPPRLVSQVIEIGSWSEEEELQQMWAALLATACTPDGRDDSNMIYTDLLSRMTVPQVRLFNHVCGGVVHCQMWVDAFLRGGNMIQKDVTLQETMQFASPEDVRQQVAFMRAIGVLRDLGRLSLLSPPKDCNVDVTPTRLALSMFMRCQGFRGTLEEFYDRGRKSPGGERSVDPL